MSHTFLIFTVTACWFLTANAQTTEIPPYCDPLSSDVRWAYPDDCSKYYECFEGRVYLRDCPLGTLFNPEVIECTFPGDFCGEGTFPTASPTSSTTTRKTTTTQRTTKTPSPSTTTTKPTTTTKTTTTPKPTTTPTPTTTTSPTTTTKSTTTIRPTTTTTPTTTTRSTTTSRPTTTTSSTTTTRPTSTTTPTTTTDGGNDGGDPRCVDDSTTYLPHPTLCHRYIECFRGESYEMQCPPSLYFDEELADCVQTSKSSCCKQHPEQCNGNTIV